MHNRANLQFVNVSDEGVLSNTLYDSILYLMLHIFPDINPARVQCVPALFAGVKSAEAWS